MATECTTKVTCDGCGAVVMFVHGKDRQDDFKPWLRLEVTVRRGPPAGQGGREYAVGERIDACSEQCAEKALALRKVEIPEET